MAKKRRLGFKTRYKREAQIKNELNEFIKEHKSQIVTKAREDLGSLSAQKIYSMFRSNFEERLKESGNVYSLSEARKAMRRTLHSETFTGKQQIEYEKLRTALIEDKSWEKFRSYNRHQKIVVENFKRADAPEGVRTRWKYETTFGKIVIIDLIYHTDGTFEFAMNRV